jgi:hypothetical protein
MMHHVPQAGLTALAVAGPVERVVRPHSLVLLMSDLLSIALTLVDSW